MRILNKIIFLVFIIQVISSCDDIFEGDITEDVIFTIYPTNDTEIESNVVNFQWQALEGASKYRIQIFGINQSILLDSLVTRTNITYPLNQGNYQWTVRGENFAYQSNYSPLINFSTVFTNDLTNQQVVLASPQNEIFVNYTNINLSWIPLANSMSYSIEVINTANGQIVYINPSITDTYVILDLPNLADGKYEWRLKAKNDTSQTQQYTSRRFTIDRVVPNMPQNTSPTDNSTQVINQPITFLWTITNETGTNQSPVSYKIEFSNDPNFTTIIQSATTNTTNFSRSFTNTGVYYWRVKSIDAAQNNSSNSIVYKFTI